MENKLIMKELPISERPYEKLEQSGTQTLSDAELLAIIIGSGTRADTAVDLAVRVISELDTSKGLVSLYSTSLQELMQVKGIGRVKAIRLKAVAELTKRISSQVNISNKRYINEPEDISRYFMEEMRRYEKEIFKVVLLNNKNVIIRTHDISIGTSNASIVNPSDAFREAVRAGCTSVIFLHNHPSGDPTPSRNDIDTTLILINGGRLLGINVFDHIIIGDGTYISMKNRGII